MKLKTPTDIIIIDPYNISRDEDWGSIFDWETGKIKSKIFTEYIWEDCYEEKAIYMMSKKINEPTLKNILFAERSAFDKIENFRDRDYFEHTLNDLHKNAKKIGTFYPKVDCIGVFILEEVIKYNPDFLTGLSIGCFTIIKEFEGKIKLERSKDQENLDILGIGNNKTFYTV